MESPVVIDKPPEYHGNSDRGFPFDEEEGSGAWSELAARHPDIAARLQQRPATWARKRRPSSQDATDDFGDTFRGFDRFPFDEIPHEFREHFPTHWNRRFGSREDSQPQQPQSTAPPQSPPQQSAATQTESLEVEQPHIPQYGLRNTVDLGQKSPADPSLVDADVRGQRSMSAPPDSCSNQSKMNTHNNQEPHHSPQQESQSNVRHIPIFVEGRDEPVINKSVDHGSNFGETKPAYVPPPPQQPHIDRDQYFADDGPANFHHPPNFSRSFGTPFNKGFRQGPQPFVQQKVYPQSAFARGASPQRSQSPKAQMHPDEHFVKVPVHHETPKPKPETPSKPQQRQQPPPTQSTQSTPQEVPQPKPQQQTSANDPITLILNIQTDVLNLMSEVENFTGTKKDKNYLYLDEMLTRNLIKLDNIETDGKENIRLARKEAIRCIQKCIAVLEAKAESKTANTQPEQQDVEMNDNSHNEQKEEQSEPKENGEVEMKEITKEVKNDPQPEQNVAQSQKDQEVVEDNKEIAQPQAVDTQSEESKEKKDQPEAKEENESKNPESVEKKPTKKVKAVKKRDKSKDSKEELNNKDLSSEKDDSKNNEILNGPEVATVNSIDNKNEKKQEAMQEDSKDSQVMEVDGALPSQ